MYAWLLPLAGVRRQAILANRLPVRRTKVRRSSARDSASSSWQSTTRPESPSARRLDALSHLAVLDRGYSIVHKIPDEKFVKDTTSLDIGDFLRVTFAKGKAICRVERKE
jgi:exonuclease VII large subunit